MIPISFRWNARKKSAWLEVDGFVSSEWHDGKLTTKIISVPISFSLPKQKTRLSGLPPVRWMYLKGMFSFLREWKMKKVEGTFSLPDPMINGILYGWMSAIQAIEPKRRIAVTVNFLGENWLKGDFKISLKTLFHHFRGWIYPWVREMRERKVFKGGEE